MRPLVEIVEKEPAAHIAREERKATAEHRPPLNAYSALPLTGCSLSLLPRYQLLQNFGRVPCSIERGEIIRDTDDADDPEHSRLSPGRTGGALINDVIADFDATAHVGHLFRVEQRH